MIEHFAPISGVATFKDQYVATAGYDNQIILWDSKKHTAITAGRHDHLANQCEFSPCGRYLVSTSSDYTARLWRIPSMQLIAVLGYHQDDVEMASFHPTQQWIVTASRDKIVRLFDFQGHLIRRFMGHERDVISVAWLGRDALLSCSDDGTVRQWDVHTGRQTATLDLGGVETDTIAIHPEGTIFAGNDEGNIIVIADNGMTSIAAHQSGIKRLCYSSSKKMLVSLSYDRKLILWKINRKNELSEIKNSKLPDCAWARSCAFLGDNHLVLATFGSHYALYDYKNDRWHVDDVTETQGINALLIKDDKIFSIGDSGMVYVDRLPHLQLSGLCNFLLSFANTVITGGQAGEITDALSGEVIYQHHSPLNCAATYLESGKEYAIIGSYTGEGIILVEDKGKIRFSTTLSLHQNAIKGIVVEDGLIFSVCADYSAAFHDTSNLSLVHYLKTPHEKIANACVAFGNKMFISASRDLKLRIFSLNTVKEFKTQHKHSIKCLAISADKNFIASADYAGHVFIYDKNLNIITRHRPTVSGISNIIPGQTAGEFIAASYDGEIYPIRFSPVVKKAA